MSWKHVTLLLSVLLLVGFASVRSGMNIPDKPAAVGTCGAVTVGGWVQANGAEGQGNTKFCYCRSDGASDGGTYQWCSLTLTHGSSLVCTGGTTTACP
jgi:hypothetical protein